jgi:hypothetical protein
LAVDWLFGVMVETEQVWTPLSYINNATKQINMCGSVKSPHDVVFLGQELSRYTFDGGRRVSQFDGL